MKPASVFFGCIFFCTIILFTGCDQKGILTEVYKYPREMWGEWIRMDTGNTWYIASNYLDTRDSKDNIIMEKQSESVIKVTRNALEFYLYASRIPNGSFNGSIVGIDDARSAINREVGSTFGGIGLTLANKRDKANGVQAKTDDDGNFRATGVIPGDGYEITGDGFSIPVYPNNSGEDIGTVAVTDGANLITSINPQSSSDNIDMMRLYIETEYNCKIVVENVGNVDSAAAQYTLTLPNGLEIVETTGSSSKAIGMLGTIEPDKTREIPIKVKCTKLIGEYEYKDIGIVTKDARGKTWEDSVSLKFNKNSVTFNIVSEGAISGVVIVPNVKTYYFLTRRTYDSTEKKDYYISDIQVPKYSDDYMIVFSGATADSESYFSFAIDRDAEKDFSKDFNWGKYVDCATEETAARVSPKDSVTYYLAKNEIVYFKVKF